MIKQRITRVLFLCWASLSLASTPLLAKQLQIISNVYINELSASNSLIADDFGETDDWLELYNANDTVVNLQGLYLSDNLDDLTKWMIAEPIEIPANAYVLFWMDGQPDQGGIHAPFKLDSDGESVYLSQMENGSLVLIDEIDFPETLSNVSYGREEDGTNQWVFFGTPSPLESNGGNDLFFETTLNYSLISGFYESDTTLTISCTDPDVFIRWTSDGSLPTNSSELYNIPIPLSETVLIRAAAFKPGYSASGFSDEFYLINEGHSLPIVQVSIDPKLLFDDEEGMYVSGTNGILGNSSVIPHNWNQNWEREAGIRFIEPNEKAAFQIQAGIKIGGSYSRGFSMKPFNVFLREETYGDSVVTYPLFPRLDVGTFHRFKLRASGSDFPLTRIRDGAVQSILFNQLDIDQMAYRPVVLYLNGAYWGFYGLREFFGKHYVETHHGVDRNNIDIIKTPYSWQEVKEGDLVDWDDLTEFIRNNDFTNNLTYNLVQDRIDVNEFINYHISEIYVANYDWPTNNVSVWRSRNNGKWRWLLYDTDWSSGFDRDRPALASLNSIEHATTAFGNDWPNGEGSTLFLRKLLTNERFKAEFVQRTCTMAQTIFAPERTTHFIDSLSEDVASEMPRTFEKFNPATSDWDYWGPDQAGGSLESWEEHLENFKSFFEERWPYVLEDYEDHFNLDGHCDIHFNFDETTNGTIVLHDNEMEIPFEYSGQYFQNVPLRVKAIPKEGYYFVRWVEVRDSTSDFRFLASENTTLTPVFLQNGTVEQPLTKAPFVEAFPNPARGKLHLQFSDLSNNSLSIFVYNILGQLIYTEVLETEIYLLEHEIDVSTWSKGVFFVKTEIGGKNEVFEVVVE